VALLLLPGTLGLPPTVVKGAGPNGYHHAARPQERGTVALSLTQGRIILAGRFLEVPTRWCANILTGYELPRELEKEKDNKSK
jgi:hypothetical protein